MKLATPTDIRQLQSDIKTLEERVNGKFALLQWMIGFSLALNMAILLKLMM